MKWNCLLRFLIKPVKNTKEQMTAQDKKSRIIKSLIGGCSVFIMAFTALTGGISHFVIGGIPEFKV